MAMTTHQEESIHLQSKEERISFAFPLTHDGPNRLKKNDENSNKQKYDS